MQWVFFHQAHISPNMPTFLENYIDSDPAEQTDVPPSDYIYATVHKALKIEIAKMAYSNIYFMWLCNCFRAYRHLKETGGFQVLLSKAQLIEIRRLG